ncbi:MAG TPA: type II toxin-antitoxin system VapC family toxin [Aquella sp.]|nr:type II toxin-antitoxin system VapC family toxin [Aquella sp.]
MKLLLDTHILLWVSQDHPSLTKQTKELIINGNNDIYFSTASIWEIMIKKSTNKLNIDIKSFVVDLYKMNIFELPIEIEHIIKLEELPNHHKDPFDRILIAQALAEPIKLITHDKIILKYSPDLILYT